MTMSLAQDIVSSVEATPDGSQKMTDETKTAMERAVGRIRLGREHRYDVGNDGKMGRSIWAEFRNVRTTSVRVASKRLRSVRGR